MSSMLPLIHVNANVCASVCVLIPRARVQFGVRELQRPGGGGLLAENPPFVHVDIGNVRSR